MPIVIVDSRFPAICSFILLGLSWLFGVISASAKGWAHSIPEPGQPQVRIGLWWYCVGKSCSWDSVDSGCRPALVACRAFMVMAILATSFAGVEVVLVSALKRTSLLRLACYLSGLAVIFSLFPWVVFVGVFDTCTRGNRELGPGWVGGLFQFALAIAAFIALKMWERGLEVTEPKPYKQMGGQTVILEV